MAKQGAPGPNWFGTEGATTVVIVAFLLVLAIGGLGGCWAGLR